MNEEDRIKHEMLKQIKEKFKDSRFFVACGRCYRLKPPILNELGTSEECSCCNNTKGHILLCETLDPSGHCRYIHVRDHVLEYKNSLCKDNVGLSWKTCPVGINCQFAHSYIELKVWELESNYKISRSCLTKLLMSTSNTHENNLRGTFHCLICQKNFPNAAKFNDHCETNQHKIKLRSTKEDSNWKYRPLPYNFQGKPKMCLQKSCENPDWCKNAHSKEELSEWKKRCRFLKEKMKFAEENALISFPEKFALEYEKCSSPASVLVNHLPGVQVTTHPKSAQQISIRTKKSFEWQLCIDCNEKSKLLNHAAFIRSSENFTICRKRGQKVSNYTKHLDFSSIDSHRFLNLLKGKAVFQVKFTPVACGEYIGHLVLEFHDSPRPALRIDFVVVVVDGDDVCNLSTMLQQYDTKAVSNWEAERKCIRFEESSNADNMKSYYRKYKTQRTTLGHVLTKSAYPFGINRENYVEEMHKFLFEEQNKRSEFLEMPGRFVVAMSENYKISETKGMKYCRSGELFAIFELPTRLTRDSGIGLLIVDSCQKVLVRRTSDCDSPAMPDYEAKIDDKCQDHIVFLFQERCVKNWNLTSGSLCEIEIKFLLDGERFDQCHLALDELTHEQISLICPDEEMNYIQDAFDCKTDQFKIELDFQQKKVLQFVQKKVNENSAKIFPMLTVIGPFGTGKTFTIIKCAEHLLQEKSDAKILICTHSNSAADLYIEKSNMLKDFKKWKGKVLRIVYEGRQLSTVSEPVKEYCLFQEMCKKNIQTNVFRYPTSEDIVRCQLIVTTFRTAVVLGRIRTGLSGSFTHIFLDEAAQTMEPEVIIPLTLADSKKTRIIVAGDHKQMTEKIYTNISSFEKKEKEDSSYTLLNRIYKVQKHLGEDKHFHSCVYLQNNYRCVKPILKLIEKLFYKEHLLNSTLKEQPPDGLLPIQFRHVQGNCVQNQADVGYYNDAEAAEVCVIIYQLLQYSLSNDAKILAKDISVVACYYEQVHLIRMKLRSKGLDDVNVQRIQNIQGREYKVMILSCVHRCQSRADDDGKYFGLLSDANLLNTALTRSKWTVITVGDALTLWCLGKCKQWWREYLKECQDKGSINVNLNAILRDLPLISKLNPSAIEFKPGGAVMKNQNASSTLNQEPPLPSMDFDDDSDVEEALPLQDEILDDMIKKVMGVTPDKITINTDSEGREHTDILDSKESQQRHGDEHRKPFFDDDHFTHDQLKNLLRNYPQVYKICRLEKNSWYSAEAVVLDFKSKVKKVLITRKRDLGRTFDGDEVVVCIKKNAQVEEKDDDSLQLHYGKVVGILQRNTEPSKKRFVCFPDVNNTNIMCPVNRCTSKFLVIKPKSSGKDMDEICIYKSCKGQRLKLSHRVKYNSRMTSLRGRKLFVVRFLRWTRHCTYPLGYVTAIIDIKDQAQYYSIAYDLPPLKHTKSIQKEVEALSSISESAHRKDLTHLFVFTIDPKGSTDLDDALSVQKCAEHESCFKIGIHIADVASVVPEDSLIDIEARNRGTTFYSGGKCGNVPMLPSPLSSKKCSLLPDGKNRPTISIFVHSAQPPLVMEQGAGEKDIGLPIPMLTMIKSNKQMTYLEAETYLRHIRANGSHDINTSNQDNLSDQLYIIWKCMLQLRLRRLDQAVFYGHPDFDNYDTFSSECTAHILIEEAMITYNTCCSHFMKKKKCDFLLRSQEPPIPAEQKLWMDENQRFIKLSLYQQSCCSLFDEQYSSDKNMENEKQDVIIFQDVWYDIEQAIDRDDIESALMLLCSDVLQPAMCPGENSYIKIQRKATMHPNDKNVIGTANPLDSHFSLRLPLYTWCSSPIRRYIDLMSQRLIVFHCKKNALMRKSNVTDLCNRDFQNNKKICRSLKQRTEDAEKYQRGMQKYMLAETESKQQIYRQAVVTEINEKGIGMQFRDLKYMPQSATQVGYGNLQLQHQEKDVFTWMIRYYRYDAERDIPNSNETQFEINNKSCDAVTTKACGKEWHKLLVCVKKLFSNTNNFTDLNQRKDVKEHFKRVIKTIEEIPICSKVPSDVMVPCTNNECCRGNKCKDHLASKSKNDIYHFRKIKKIIYPGISLCVQLNAHLNRGLLEPSVQLLSLSSDIDLCLFHRRNPIITFASNYSANTFENINNLEQYRSHWIPLLRMDGIYNAATDYNCSITLQNVAIEWSCNTEIPEQNLEYAGKFSLDKGFCDARLLEFHIHDFLCIRYKNLKSDQESRSLSKDNAKPKKKEQFYTWVAHARIVDVEKCCIQFEVINPVVGEMHIPLCVNGDTLATVEVLQLGSTHRNMVNALELVKDGLQNSDIIRRLGVTTRKSVCKTSLTPASNTVASVGKEVVHGFSFALNEVQIRLIKKALTCNLSFIQGPPGTGKSYVGAHLAYYFHQLNFEKGLSSRVLYCGPSNKSVDVVAEYLLKCNLKVLRVYGMLREEQDFPNPLKPSPPQDKILKQPDKKIQEISLHHVIRKRSHFSEEILAYDKQFKERASTSDYKAYKELISLAKIEEIENHDIIICTCATAAVISKISTHCKDTTRKKKISFSQCIIDECGMCSEPETLTPIITSQAKQLVLIGDHMQLQPIIRCKLAKDWGLGISMFERLHDEAAMLTIQYRMNSGICDFPSKQFYDCKLQTDKSVITRDEKQPCKLFYPKQKNTAIFCHIVGTEANNVSLDEGGEYSKYNEKEARAVIKILLYLLSKEIPKQSIMILSPYTAQCLAIKSILEKERSQLNDVHVGTVITSQGSERDYVIISMVRSQPIHAIEDEASIHWRRTHIGFVADPHQINVAITRAKCGLCIVGNRHLLAKDATTWNHLLSSYENQKSIVDFDSPEAPWYKKSYRY